MQSYAGGAWNLWFKQPLAPPAEDVKLGYKSLRDPLVDETEKERD